MPIDDTAPATSTGTDRRAFLTRTAAGGALVATVATTGVAGLGLAVAGAQEGTTAPLTAEQEFAAAAAPLELAASVAYEAALAGATVSPEMTRTLRQFQRNHQDVATTLTGAMHADADAPLADPAVVTRFSPPAGADEAAVATLLASLEESLAATHLGAIATFEDSSFAKTVSQVLAVEEQQAVVLGRAGGASIEALTPATSSTEGALQAGQPVPASGFGTDDTGGSADGSEEGNATDSGNETDTGEDDTRTDTDSGSNSADDTTN